MSTLDEIVEKMEERMARFQNFVAESGMVQDCTVAEWAIGKVNGVRFLYVETGTPRFVRVIRASKNGDVYTDNGFGGTYWWCCCPGDKLWRKA